MRRIAIVVAAIGIVAVGAWWVGRPAPPPATSGGRPAPPAPARVAPPRAATPAPPREAPRPRAPRAKPAAPAATDTGAAVPTKGTLNVTSDVAGASVFLDRNYVGTTPLTLDGVEPGARRLNVTAEGYDGYADTVTIAPGANDVTVRFKEVRLSASVAVVHKHAMGACEGRLVADTHGIRYDTSRKDDAFALAFNEVDAFEIDYLKHTLRVKKRGGRTWNFTDRQPTADALFVFHRDVEKARQKLAGAR